MNTDHVDRDHWSTTGALGELGTDASVRVEHESDAVQVIVTQAFGPKGDNLVTSEVTFDGYPAVSVLVRCGDREGMVYLSPIHGDNRKSGMTNIEPGTRCELLCPISKQPLDRVGDLETDHGTRYYAIYLTPQLSSGSMVAVSDEWGHYHSRIVDNFELIATWMGDDEQQ